jgi:hypothetical protein
MSQKSAGFVQFASVVHAAWHVALMQVSPAFGQSALNTQACVGLGLLKQYPPWQVSPVPHCASVAHGVWQLPSTHSPPPHSPEYVHDRVGSTGRAGLQMLSQQVSPAGQSLSTVQPDGFATHWPVVASQWLPVVQSASVVQPVATHVPRASHDCPTGQSLFEVHVVDVVQAPLTQLCPVGQSAFDVQPVVDDGGTHVERLSQVYPFQQSAFVVQKPDSLHTPLVVSHQQPAAHCAFD